MSGKWFELKGSGPSGAQAGTALETLCSALRHYVRGYLPGSKLPGLGQLARHFGTSLRVTRLALERLTDEGLIRSGGRCGSVVLEAATAVRPATIRRVILIAHMAGPVRMGREGAILGVDERCMHYRLPLEVVRGEPDWSRPGVLEEIAEGDPLEVGWVLMAALPPHRALLAWRIQGVPFVIVDEVSPAMVTDWVNNDAQGAIYRAAEMLILLGHRRIAYAGPTSIPGWLSEQRMQGIQLAHQHHQLEVDPELLWDTGSARSRADRLAFFMDKLQRSDRPTGLVTNDQMTGFMAMAACDRLGIKVPGQISIVCGGMNRRELEEEPRRPSAWSQGDPEELGRHAVDVLVNRANAAGPVTILIPSQWIDRGSTGPPPSA